MASKSGWTESTDNLANMPRVESPEELVVGSSKLFDGDNIRFVPMPTPDPKDPLNLPTWRKWSAIAALCFFGSLALSAEFIVGALVPVFVLEYSGIDPHILSQIDIGALNKPGEVNLDPIKILAGLGGPPLYQVALLASVPLLVNGLSSYLLVPLSIAIGRRPVLLLSGFLAWTGGLWAGFSQGLGSHLAARCFQGFGAGAVEALIPLIIQDMMFIHQRNQAISSVGASQGLLVVSLGIASPLIVSRLTWRFIYWITSGVGVLAWIGLILLVPETRWIRSDDELAGKEVYPLRPGETRPRIDEVTYRPRSNWDEFGIMNYGYEWKEARKSTIDMFKTTLFPNIIWVIIINSILVSLQGALSQVASSLLIAAGWKFETLGFIVIPILVASPFIWFFGGYVADWISNFIAKRNGGQREPEAHLISLIFPILASIVGPILFGYAGEHIRELPSIVVLVSIFLVGFGLLTANTIFAVYLVESYPRYAGPVLVNVSSARLIVGFIMSFNVTTWIEELGFFKNFGIYSAALAGVSMLLPVMYKYGKPMRAWTAGRLEPSIKPAKAVEDDEQYWNNNERPGQWQDEKMGNPVIVMGRPI
ncbi:major facilitator superfamily transporter [Colletotrichum zoysiae]|uniref:Major facilitator superfamily transporter n=1 Tax=Colletotrichum zoysiae TaxID=1216348 RepID=A0AAD9HRJ6_9PEZI|nr:major facilitator superfamily transporter [Colletotrichum zoysiae]